MTASHPATGLDIYQHDSAEVLRFVLRGVLAGAPAQYLEHAWTTAASTLGTRRLLVDVTEVTDADNEGLALLLRMRAQGAQLVARGAPASGAVAHHLGLADAAASDSERSLWRTMLALVKGR